MIFYVFYSSFSLHDGLENIFYEQLEWLKFKKSTPPKSPFGGGLIASPDPTAVSRTAYGSAKISWPKIKNIALFLMYLTLSFFSKISSDRKKKRIQNIFVLKTFKVRALTLIRILMVLTNKKTLPVK